MALGLGEVGEGWPGEGAGTVEPCFMLPGGEGAAQAQAAGVVGEEAHDQRTAREFLMEAFEEVGALAVFGLGVRASQGSGGGPPNRCR